MLINADAFAGRVALVTGASRGIGAAVAKKLTEAGAFVVGTATSEKGAEAVSAALGEKGRGIVLNVTDRAACAEAVNAVVTEFGRIDILVNNAGITRDMLAMRLSDEDWDAVIATNTTIDHSSVQGLPHWEETGGLSGKPLMERSTECLRLITEHLKGERPVIASGGVMTGEDAVIKMQAGAALVQLYSGFVYKGPALVAECVEAVAKWRAEQKH